MISNHHRAKNVFGELTFGEYWNLVGCHASAFKIKGHKGIGTLCFPDDSAIKFVFGDGSFFKDGSESYIRVPLSSRARVSGNRVITKDSSGMEAVIDFFELSPLDFDPPKKI